MPNSQEVADYLKKNPQFVVEHRDLLAGLEVSPPPDAPLNAPAHARLQERQVQALRDRQARQQARLDWVVDTARSNHDLEHGLHQIAVNLLSLGGGDAEAEAAPALLVKSRFDIDKVAIFLASRRHEFAAVDYPSLCQRVAHLGSVCDDRVSSQLAAALFPGASAIASCAFIPLAHRQNLYGVMVLGAADKTRFQPDMGVMILDRLGQLIGAYLAGRNLAV